MKIQFDKYQGAGNDFILIDDRHSNWSDSLTPPQIAKLCDRRFGIGADGLIFLKEDPNFDFEMLYHNADGARGSMCGNGGRCIVAYAHHLTIFDRETLFMAVDGKHEARILEGGDIDLKMGEPSALKYLAEDYFIHTGSPHYIRFVEEAWAVNVVEEGQKVRYSERFKQEGTNVNFVEIIASNHLKVATYERGVENETLACGTGATAAAIVYVLEKTAAQNGSYYINIEVKGGTLAVQLTIFDGEVSDIWLSGSAQRVYWGEFEI